MEEPHRCRVSQTGGVNTQLSDLKRRVERHEADLISRGFPVLAARSLAVKIASRAAQLPIDVEALIEVLTVYRNERLDCIRGEIFLRVLQLVSDAETLSWSFFDKHSVGQAGSFDTDFCLLRKFYEEVVRTRDEELIRALMGRTSVLLRSDSFANADSDSNRALLILLLNPVLAEVEYFGVLLEALKLLRSARGPAKADLVARFENLAKEEVNRLLEILHQYLTITIMHCQSGRSGRALDNSVEMMSVMFEANQGPVAVTRERLRSAVLDVLEVMSLLFEANQQSGAVGHEAFYNCAVNSDEFDVVADFRLWQGGSSGSSRPFCFCNYPFVYDSGSKSQIMKLENHRAQGAAFEDAFLRGILDWSVRASPFCPFLLIRVRREFLLQDTMHQVQAAKRSQSLKRPLKVEFHGEAGVDGGGLAKEFFQLLLGRLFDVDYGMFTHEAEERFWWFRCSDMDLEPEFDLVGIALGLAIFNHHILDLKFPLVVYKKLLGHKPVFEDLKQVYPDIYSSLGKLLDYEGDVGSLGLTFEIERDTGFGERIPVPLIPDGSEIPVTNRNRTQFVKLYTNYLLVTSIEHQFNSFRSGFLSVCLSESLKMFLPEELEQAVCGKQDLNLEGLEQVAAYEEGYTKSSRIVRWFWEHVHSLADSKKKKLLSFVTGSDRVPIRGFSALNPAFTISRADCPLERLPTAHTCFNHLALPEYNDKSTLVRRLNTAIENYEGFGLT